MKKKKLVYQGLSVGLSLFAAFGLAPAWLPAGFSAIAYYYDSKLYHFNDECEFSTNDSPRLLCYDFIS